ncbi:5' nucleotidase, NT5C type [Olivibacter domesticus]|uniref:5'(3')-deoxyribonucleotidase n=1 Tax=Olivibacter domesticus TaxID=407022 RepID=A0A1H7I1F1_OLID1|nr:5'(3')-deoxyribonucleotidase [Olivibacter domesticus]SEK56204.1 5'(3')-deoxyribonucleotidase [Olivibacter domesticus]
MKKKSIAIDMDGVLADTEVQYLNYYEQQFGTRLTKEIFHNVAEAEALPDGSIYKFLFTPGFFRTIPVMDGAVDAVKTLQQDYDIYIVSAAMEFPLSLFEKKEWLEEHFPFIQWNNIIFCGNKSIIDTDYMIDDYCKNLDFCKGKPILFSAGHNASITHHVRVNNWKEVETLFAEERSLARQ